MTETAYNKPLPLLEGLTKEFYDWCAKGELRFQRCNSAFEDHQFFTRALKDFLLYIEFVASNQIESCKCTGKQYLDVSFDIFGWTVLQDVADFGIDFIDYIFVKHSISPD